VQQAFVDHDAFQCGYCTPGRIISAIACVTEGHAGNDADIREDMSGNLCRCGAYPNIVDAVKDAKAAMQPPQKDKKGSTTCGPSHLKSDDGPRRHSGGQLQSDNGGPVQFLAGGTTLVDLMKLDVMRPAHLVDINALAASELGRIEAEPKGLRLGALVRMADAAEHGEITTHYPVIAQSLKLAASQQIKFAGPVARRLWLAHHDCAEYRGNLLAKIVQSGPLEHFD
jgi:xanthine dehydrogenase iron-sulfur cluster and FAD-binding subunit A